MSANSFCLAIILSVPSVVQIQQYYTEEGILI
jgi:hypothetical protein